MSGEDKPRRVSRDLPCKLTTEEKLDLLEQIGAVGGEIQDLEAKIGEINANKRPKVKERKKLERIAEKGEQVKTIMCEVHEGPGVNIRIVRLDTGETVEQRPMTPEERQGNWLAETEKAAERGKQKARKGGGGSDDGDEEDEDEDDDSNVLPFGSRAPASKKAARKPGKGGGKGKGRKR